MTNDNSRSNDEVIERFLSVTSRHEDKTITLEVSHDIIYMNLYNIYSDNIDFLRLEKTAEEHLVNLLVLSLHDSLSVKFSSMKINHPHLWKEILMNSILHGHHINDKELEKCNECNIFITMKS